MYPEYAARLELHLTMTNEPTWDPADLNKRYDGPLVACPFCASAFLQMYTRSFAHTFSIICKSCGGMGPRLQSPADAAEAWNKRGTIE